MGACACAACDCWQTAEAFDDSIVLRGQNAYGRSIGQSAGALAATAFSLDRRWMSVVGTYRTCQLTDECPLSGVSGHDADRWMSAYDPKRT